MDFKTFGGIGMDYFVYRGDNLITWGDLKHVATFLGIKEASVKWHTKPSSKKRKLKLEIYTEKELGI